MEVGLLERALRLSWTIDKISGILVVAGIILLLFLISAFKRLIANFERTNRELLHANNDIALENQRQMAKLTESINALTLETRKDISVLQAKIDNIDDIVRENHSYYTKGKDER